MQPPPQALTKQELQFEIRRNRDFFTTSPQDRICLALERFTRFPSHYCREVCGLPKR